MITCKHFCPFNWTASVCTLQKYSLRVPQTNLLFLLYVILWKNTRASCAHIHRMKCFALSINLLIFPPSIRSSIRNFKRDQAQPDPLRCYFFSRIEQSDDLVACNVQWLTCRLIHEMLNVRKWHSTEMRGLHFFRCAWAKHLLTICTMLYL